VGYLLLMVDPLILGSTYDVIKTNIFQDGLGDFSEISGYIVYVMMVVTLYQILTRYYQMPLLPSCFIGLTG
jgi:hypothetical protein